MNTLLWIFLGIIIVLVAILSLLLYMIGGALDCFIPKLPKKDNFLKKILKKFGILK